MASSPSSSSSAESDSSSVRSSSPEPTNKQKPPANAPEASEDEGSSSGSESESDLGSSSESGSSEEPEPTSKGQPAEKVTIPSPQRYKPPSGFKSAKTQPRPSSTVTSLLSNLHGKQVFHITAPSTLPLSKVKEVSMPKILQGEPILTHEGVNYGIPVESLAESDSQGKTLLVYDETAQTYRSAADHIPSYHVQEMISLPVTFTANDAAASTIRDASKPRRPQPKHLKMRFRPVGSRAGPPETIGSSSDSDLEAEEPSFTVPPGEHEKEKKRKHPHAEGDAVHARKKSKKHAALENGVGAAPDEQGHKKSKKPHKNREEKKRKKSERA